MLCCCPTRFGVLVLVSGTARVSSVKVVIRLSKSDANSARSTCTNQNIIVVVDIVVAYLPIHNQKNPEV